MMNRDFLNFLKNCHRKFVNSSFDQKFDEKGNFLDKTYMCGDISDEIDQYTLQTQSTLPKKAL